MQSSFPGLDPSYVPPDAAPPLSQPTALVVATAFFTGRVLAMWTDVEHAAGRAPSLGEPINLHTLPLGSDVRIGHPLPGVNE